MEFGHIVEGYVEQDPLTGRCTIRALDIDGNPVNFDLERALLDLVGQEVRLTLASVETINRLAAELQRQGDPGVVGIGAVGLPPGLKR